MIALTGFAQGKLDVASRSRLRAAKAPIEMSSTGKAAKIKARAAAAEEQVLGGFVTLKKGSDAGQLEAAGATVKRVRGTMAIVEFPESILAQIEALDCVERISLQKPVEVKMDLVREAVGVDKIHSGDGLSQPYTGKGIVAGIVDGGFDPNHVNFLDEDGNHRIKKFTYFRPTQSGSLVQQDVYGDEISEIDTENSESFHATHTTGIMAGSYRGKVTVAKKRNSWQTTLEEVDNPYYGIAYDSDIVTASAYNGLLSDQYIALGVESILDYAYGATPADLKPCVVNLSLGSNVGPHDGTSPICQYLDAIVNDDQVNAIVCISAGNEGDIPLAISRTFTEDTTEVKTGLYAMYNGYIKDYQNPRSGLVYIYSNDNTPFDVQAMIVNTDRGAAALRMPLEGKNGGGSIYWVSSTDYQQDESDQVSAQFAKYLHGYVGVNAEYDSYSGRYYSVIDFLTFDNVEGINASGKYALCIQVNGKPGQRIDIYGDGSMCNFTDYDMEGYSDGEFNGTINDIATGKNTIIVGSYNMRDDWASLDGGIYGYAGNFLPGKMSAFTSFGSLIDGRKLPDICAPGATVISSYNEAYLDAYEAAGADIPSQVQARCEANGRKYSWSQCVGTSMAAPVVTGTMALWLEAYPELTAKQAKEILLETAVKDDAYVTSGDPIQWGAGKMDAYAGLLKVIELKNNGIKGVSVENDNRLILHNSGRGVFDVTITDASSLTVKVFDLAGRCVASVASDSNSATIDLSILASGVYVLKANDLSTKIAL